MVTQVTTANFSSATLTALTSPTITSITVTNNAYVPTGETAVSLSGGYVTVVGSSFVSGATVYIDSTPATAVTFVNSTQLNVQVPGLASNSYIVYVINLDGSVAIRVNGINYSANPTWVTSGTQAYSSGTISLQLVASSDSTVIYTVASGSSLPAGLTLTSSGLLSGVVTGSGIITYNFSVVATDVETQRSTQAFSITITFSDPYWNYTTLLLNGETPVTSFITDASTNNFNSTIAGDTKPIPFIPYQAGYYSNQFLTSTDYLTTPVTTSNSGFGTGDFTVEAWIYLTSTASNTTIVTSNYTYTTAVGNWSFYMAPGASPLIYFNAGGANHVSSTTAPGTILPNQWIHMAYSKSSSSGRFFINGVQVGTAVSDTSNYQSSAGSLFVGRQSTGDGPLLGYISNLRIVNGSGLYSTGFTPSTAPLTSITNTSLLTCQSNRFVDNSINNYAITKFVNATVQTFNPFGIPTSTTVNDLYSTYFDGTGDYLQIPHNTALDFGTGDFSVEAWVYPTGDVAYSAVITKDTGNGAGWFMEYSATRGFIVFWASNTISSAGAYVKNSWSHLVFCRSGTTVSIYRNGTRLATTTSSASISSALNLRIGNDATTSYFPGNISNARVVKGSSPYDATQATLTVPTTPLTAISGTSLLTCQNSTLIDNSTYVFTITSFDQAQPIAVSPFTQTTTSVALTTLGSSYFDGTGDQLSYANNPAFAFFTSNFTVECWIYPLSAGGQSVMNYSNGQSTNSNFAWETYQVNGTTIQFSILDSDGGTAFTASSTGLLINRWNHIAGVRNGNTMSIYVNGIVGGTAVSVTGVSVFNKSGATLKVSGYNNATGMYTGYIEDVRIVKGTAVYTANFAPPISQLTAVTNTSLLTLQYNGGANNSGIIDNSSLNNVITRFGNTSQGTFSPYGSNWSNYFPATGNYLYGSNAIYNISSASAVWTIEMWVYPLTNANWLFFAIGSGGTYGNSLLFGFNSSNRFNLGQGIGGSPGGPSIISANTYSTNAWYHVAGTRTSAGVIVLYVNGVAAGTQTYVTGVASGSTFVVNGVYDNNGLGNSGGQFYTQDVRLIIGTALGTGSTYPVPTAPLTAINGTVLLTCQSAGFVDNGPLAVAISFGGSPVAQRFSPFAQVIQTPISYSGYFNGSSGLTVSSTSAQFSFAGDFTWEAWINLNSLPGGAMSIICSRGSTASNSAFQFLINNTSGTYSVVATISIGSADSNLNWNIPSTPTLGVWYHVAVVRSGSSVQAYWNGSVIGSPQTASGTTNTPTLNPTIGFRGPANNDLYLNGYISNFRMVGSAVYTSTFTPSTTPLTAIQSVNVNGSPSAAITGTATRLLTCQSTTFIDNSTNAFTITAYSGPAPRTFNPFGVTNNTNQAYTPALYGGSSYFDGTGDYLRSGPYTGQSLFTPSFSAAQNVSATIEFWVYPTSTGLGRPYSYTTASVSTGADVGIYFVTNGSGSSYSVQFGWYNATSGFSVTGGAALPYSWTHVAGTYNPSGGVGTLYVNGVSVGTPVSGGNVNGGPNSAGNYSITNAYNYIGVYSPGSSPSYFTGYMTDFRYTLKSIVYTSNFVPPQAPLTATTNNTTMLLNFTNGGIIDYHTNNVLETVGNAQLSTGLKQFGNASMYFDGTGDYLLSPSTQFQNYNFGTGDFTIECWLYQTAFSGDKTIIASVTTWSTSVNFYFATRAGTPNILLFRGGDSIPITLNGNTGITASTWTHVAVTRASGVTRMFVDGVVQTATHTGSVNVGATVQSTWVGAWGSAINEPMTGYIDELRVTKGIARYTATFPVPTSAFQTI